MEPTTIGGLILLFMALVMAVIYIKSSSREFTLKPHPIYDPHPNVLCVVVVTIILIVITAIGMVELNQYPWQWNW